MNNCPSKQLIINIQIDKLLDKEFIDNVEYAMIEHCANLITMTVRYDFNYNTNRKVIIDKSLEVTKKYVASHPAKDGRLVIDELKIIDDFKQSVYYFEEFTLDFTKFNNSELREKITNTFISMFNKSKPLLIIH